MSGEEVERFEDGGAAGPPEGFEARVLARLAAEAEARRDVTLGRVTPGLGAAEAGRRVGWGAVWGEPRAWGLALGAAAVAAVVAFAVARGTAPVGAGEEAPAAFVRPGAEEVRGEARVRYDARGRLAEIAPVGGDGEGVVLRAGRGISSEHVRGGVLEGAVVDFDARGGVVAVRTYVGGREVGPWVELDGRGKVTGTGVR